LVIIRHSTLAECVNKKAQTVWSVLLVSCLKRLGRSLALPNLVYFLGTSTVEVEAGVPIVSGLATLISGCFVVALLLPVG
jgi:hypothetical protein